MIWIILILTGIGLVCGVLIFVANKVLPPEPKALQKAERINEKLPGMNCGACGLPGCFAYAQALAKDKNTFFSNTCATVLQNRKMLEDLEKILDIKVDTSAMNKRAVVCCTGGCGYIAKYDGINSCNTASKLLAGPKKCPYGCLGLGDCLNICPQHAIRIDKDMNVAVIDPSKCTGCGLCVKECPRNIIKLVPADAKVVFRCSYDSLRDIPGREKCDYGCLHCRKCFKACENGAIVWNKEKAIPEFDYSKCNECGACIEACPHNKLVLFKDLIPKKEKVKVK